jgi:hypothetical protein
MLSWEKNFRKASLSELEVPKQRGISKAYIG